MKRSSARLRQPDLFDGLGSGQTSEHSESAAEVASFSDTGNDGRPELASSAPLRISTFGLPDQVYADAARRAGRLNAANISDQEYSQLLRERQQLLDKKFAGAITKSESNKLEYVRWSLDRIEDARHGAALDALESSVEKFEKFLEEVEDLKLQLDSRVKGSRK